MKKSDLRREIIKKSSSYTDEELFGSDYYEETLAGYVISVCERLNRIPNIRTYYDPKSNSTAMTDGNDIYQNTAGPLIRDLDTRWKKHVSNIGHTTHECGHVLFTDFKNLNPLREGWRKTELVYYPTVPDGGEEVKAYLDTHPNFKNVFVQIMDNLVNILEDIYEENCCYEYFDGLCTAGLKIANDQIFERSEELAVMLSNVLTGDVFLPHVITNIIHLQGMGYEVKNTLSLSKEMEDLKRDIDWFLHESKKTIDTLHWESDGVQRCLLFNELFVELFKLMPQPPENEDMSKEESKKVKENQKSECSEMPHGNTEGISPKSLDHDSIKEAKEKAKSMSSSENIMERCQEQDSQSIAESEIIMQEEKNHIDQLESEIKDIGHDFFNGYKFDRKLKVNDVDIRKYNCIYAEIQKTSKNLVRKISNILKERQTEGYDTGYLMGQRFNAKDVFHNDGKYFSKQLVPDGQPDVAFGVLIDESGSMGCDDNWEKARRVAILFESVLRELQIPNVIVGHDSDYNCIVHSYVDFDTIDNNDRYRLVDIQARYGNIDGAAITYIGNKLLQRPEQRKVLIVISDGEPAGSSFYDPRDCNNDTRLAAQKYRKLGINVFGAIVDEYDSVAEIYDKKYAFDCRKNETLEKEFIKLIKRYVLAK